MFSKQIIIIVIITITFIFIIIILMVENVKYGGGCTLESREHQFVCCYASTAKWTKTCPSKLNT